ncbi:uncharacterized protein LOC128252444 isoform X3 [Drosophila gunungcola]|uniref:uncharacterized protein LOC128252444 isoform X3 n=1 Tax=Drosophila gunungcola TaxID=103775 RepID=UPI0022E7BF2E|nr:uncharacterized protein LOC128252444 isoform X3 [Drosophila gunungcola]
MCARPFWRRLRTSRKRRESSLECGQYLQSWPIRDMTNSEPRQSDEELVYKLGQEDPELLPWPNFESRISDPTVNSVRLEWSLLKNALVYSVEKFNKRLGWMQVHWTTSSPVDVNNLEENFGYRLRVKALRVSEDGRRYVPLAISPDIIACTTAALPSTSCLNRAIRKGQQFLVKRMLRRRPSLVEYPAPNGFLPLANAIIQGEMCIIDVLLSAGCSVHLGNPGSGRTPLHVAGLLPRSPAVGAHFAEQEGQPGGHGRQWYDPSPLRRRCQPAGNGQIRPRVGRQCGGQGHLRLDPAHAGSGYER